MRDAEAARRLDTLRSLRPTYRPGQAVGGGGGVLEAVVASLKQQDTKLARAERAVRQALPAELAARCTVASLKGQTLTLGVPNAAIRYRVDRWLRSGGEAIIAENSKNKIRHVRIMIGSGPTTPLGTT